MADVKRNNNAGKVATPKTGGSPSATNIAAAAPSSLDVYEGLGKALGAKIRVTLAAGPTQVIEGTLFTACPILNVIAINSRDASIATPSNPTTAPGDYHVIPIPHIQSFQVIALAMTTTTTAIGSHGSSGQQKAFENAQPAIGPIDVNRMKERENERIRQLKEQEKDKGVGVTREAQAIFDSFKRINMPIRWHNQEMIVDNSVIISPPYRSEDCKAGKEKQQALNHVRRVLDGERKKLKDRDDRERSKAVGNGNGSGSRKGG